MLVVLTAIFTIIYFYKVLIQNRRHLLADSTMIRKIKSASSPGSPDLTNDESDLMTEQSLSSDLTSDIEIIESEEAKEDSETDSPLQEELDYTQMKIEEPPSFLNSQYLNPDNILKPLEKNVEAFEDEIDEVFQKKPERMKRRAFGLNTWVTSGNDKAGPSSISSRSNRKPRKPRLRNNKDTENVFYNWLEKREDLKKKETQFKTEESEITNKDKVPIDSQSSSQSQDVESVPECSTVSTSTTNPVESRKKHITVAFEEKDVPPKDERHFEVLKIAGVNVKFPVKPYPSQIAVMNKLIQGCKKEEHCLLESPTGSGKTLALLCGVLAWQEHMKEEIRQNRMESAQKFKEYLKKEPQVTVGAEESIDPTVKVEHDTPSNSAGNSKNADECEESGESQPLKKVCRSISPNSVDQKLDFITFVNNVLFSEDEEKKPKKVPKIFYGSRTHKQIEQVIRELKKTAYSNKTMTILSSREFTCIQNTDKNKTEVCTKLLDPTKGLGCRYYNENTRSKLSSNRALNRNDINGPWDIEDLVNIGRELSTCPYFAARDLMVEAEIVFCPYNYLVDPNIRQSMQIHLDGQVVILDEAHNIEEMSRDVGSLSFREDKITEVIEETELLCIKRKPDFDTYNTIKTYLKSLKHFMNVNKLDTVDQFSDTSSSAFWTGAQLCELFNIHSLGKGIAKTFETAASAAIMDFNTAKEEISKKQTDIVPSPVITPIAKRFLEDLVLALEMMSSEKWSPDYRACIMESNIKEFDQSDNTRGPRYTEKRLRTLQMLCMNPAVVFAPIANVARCIVLASGTLSPINSFQSELGTIFPHKLDANHVVPKENVYVRGIPCGPTGVQLKANYANVNSWNFQDELGRLVLDVCKVIPHGVLCFFSSYSMMQKQIDRWKQNSCWDKLKEVKHIFQEPRGSTNLETVMQEFRDVIRMTSEKPQNGITGALLLAVFRGKVAEGIDFSDNEARCVMAIGIPYAVRRDPSVDMKFTYNDLNQPKGLLKGGEWYAVQAFRALNQALGRCVRHRNDWGAILLIDQRFLEKSNYHYLPKWVKTMWRNSVRYSLTHELQEFVARQLERSQEEKLVSADTEISKK